MSLPIAFAAAALLLAPQQPEASDPWVVIGGNERVAVAVRPGSVGTDSRGRKSAWFTYALVQTEDFEGRVVDYVTYKSEFDCRRRTIRNITNLMYRLGAPASYPTFRYDRPAEPPVPESLDDYQLRYVCDGDVGEGPRFDSAEEFVRQVREAAGDPPSSPGA